MTVDEIPVHESTRRRRRWGCTCGCLVFVLLLLLALAAFLVYIFRPVKPQPRPIAMDAGTDGFALLRLDTDDEGVGELANFVLKRAEARMKQQVAPEDRKAVAAYMTLARKSFDKFVYPDVTILLSRDTAGDEAAVAAVQLQNRTGVLIANMYLNDRFSPLDSAMTTEALTASTVYLLDADSADIAKSAVIALAGQTLLWSDSLDLAARAVSAGAAATGAGGATTGAPEQLQSYIDSLNLDQPMDGRDLAFAALTPPGRILGWLDSVEQWIGAAGLSENLETNLNARKADLTEIQGVTVTGDIKSADEAVFTATLWGRRNDMAKRLADALRLALNQSLQRAEGAVATSGISTKVDVKQLGTSIVIGLQISGIKKVIERYLPLAPEPEAPPRPESPAEAAGVAP